MAMKTRVVPPLALAAVVAAGSFAVKAEPLLLTSSQMEAVTAGLALNVSPQINVNAGNGAFLQQLNLTTQTAQAFAVAVATCGVCSGNIPAADAAAAAVNASRSANDILR
jgi:hypothetical protein